MPEFLYGIGPKPVNVKEPIVKEREYQNRVLKGEEIAE